MISFVAVSSSKDIGFGINSCLQKHSTKKILSLVLKLDKCF